MAVGELALGAYGFEVAVEVHLGERLIFRRGGGRGGVLGG